MSAFALLQSTEDDAETDRRKLADSKLAMPICD